MGTHTEKSDVAPLLRHASSRVTSARGTLPPKLKELTQLKVAAMVGCPL
jgi:hypothetical protein